MSKLDDKAWKSILKKLYRERKVDLIQLLKELAEISPDVQRFMQARYLPQKKTADQIAPFRRAIQCQFKVSDWNSTVEWNFAGVRKVIDDYRKSSPEDAVGQAELLVVALETAVKFADSLNLQADDFDIGLVGLADNYVDHIYSFPELRSHYVRRLKAVQNLCNELGYYGVGDTLDNLYDNDS